MTEKELALTAWLNRGFYADKKIKVLEQCVRQSRERAAGFTGCCTSMILVNRRGGKTARNLRCSGCVSRNVLKKGVTE